jgi:hypothetical protein
MSNYIGNAPGVGQDQLYVYSPAAGSTTLTGADLRGISLAYTVGEPFVEVQVNGTILAPSDYTATTGNTIVLTSGSFNTGDLVVVRARSALSLANTYTQAAADALLALKLDIPNGWTAYTPSFSASTGTITTASCAGRYKKIGSICHLVIGSTITTNGTGTGTVQIGLPFSHVAQAVLAGRETSITGNSIHGITNGSVMSVFTYNNQYPGGNGYTFVLSGSYEVLP